MSAFPLLTAVAVVPAVGAVATAAVPAARRTAAKWTALGFALTAFSIRLLPVWTDAVGWRWAFAPLAIGPALGVLAMARLRAAPEASRLAGGRR